MNKLPTLRHFCHRLLLLLAAILTTSCGSGVTVKGTGIGRVLQSDCSPVANQNLLIVNRTNNNFLSAGRVSVDNVDTDDEGYFEFDVGAADYLHFYSTHGRNLLIRELRANIQIGSYERVNELTHAMASSHKNPLIIYQHDGGRNGFASVRHIRARYSEWFNHMDLGLSDVTMRFGFRGRDALLIISAGRYYKVAEVAKTEKGRYIVGEFRKNIVYDKARDIKSGLFLFSGEGKEQSVIISLRQVYNPETEKTLFLAHRLNLGISQHAPGPLMASLETCGGHMDQGVEGFYTDPEVLVPASMAWLGKPTEVGVQSLLQVIGYIDSGDAMGRFSNEPRLTEELLMKLIDYDFFDASYTQSIIDLAQQRNWFSALDVLKRNLRPKQQYDDMGRAIKPSVGVTMLSNKINHFNPETIYNDTMEHMYCMNHAYEELVSDPDTPDSIMLDIVEKYPSYRFLPFLLMNPTSPPDVLEKIYFRDYPDGSTKYELLSCDHRLPPSIRKYTYVIPPRACKTDFQKNILELIDGTRKKVVLNLDCDAYREKTLTSLHPEVDIQTYGVVYERSIYDKHPSLGTKVVSEENSNIIDSDTGGHFGILYKLEGDEYYRYLGNNVNLIEEITGPDGRLITQGVKTKNSHVITKGLPSSHQLSHTYALYIQVDDIWPRGDWTFRIRHKGKILAEQVITVK